MDGQRSGWITRVLGLPRMSLSQWIRGVNEQGVNFLRPSPRSGLPGQLSEKLFEKLEDHLVKSLRDFGWSRVGWDGPTLVVHLKKYFGMNLEVRQAEYWMHRLGCRMKRASYVYLQARSEDAKRFRQSSINSGALSETRQLSLRMRRALALILVWDGDGQSVVDLLRSLRPVSMESG